MFSALFTFVYYFPLQFFCTVLIMFLISIITFILLRRSCLNNKICKSAVWWKWSLANYSLILLYITTFGRRSWDYYRYNFQIGYSYREAFLMHNSTFIKEVLLNIAIFIPIGMICFFCFKKLKIIFTFVYGLALSAIIECSQLILKKGTFEFDDLISNTLGSLIGIIILLILYCIYNFFRMHISIDARRFSVD